jgi:hypothetical protein
VIRVVLRVDWGGLRGLESYVFLTQRKFVVRTLVLLSGALIEPTTSKIFFGLA